jgi:hypothetical protein
MKSVACGGSGEEEVECRERGMGRMKKVQICNMEI